ncbi:hypothetical protein BDFB_014333, partial [Asbolus verrucosus]
MHNLGIGGWVEMVSFEACTFAGPQSLNSSSVMRRTQLQLERLKRASKMKNTILNIFFTINPQPSHQ